MSPESESHEDLVARLLAQGDQIAAGAAELGRNLALIRDALLVNGFTTQEAFALVTLAYSTHLAAAYGIGEVE